MDCCYETVTCEACGGDIHEGDACAAAMVVELTYSAEKLGIHRGHTLAVFCRDCFDDDCIHGLVVLDPSGMPSVGAVAAHHQ